ncbi:hypothetical protein [Bacillus mycoides]|uniref:hypothetical protein n=1 Tax=Bacillus mycoides TaxID=1405 RepID=UPI000BF459BF|nr:hypothetical protein [Bacillus mycoides]PGA05613.1 hypothetical protein COL71_25720 [Bacillus mycoides]
MLKEDDKEVNKVNRKRKFVRIYHEFMNDSCFESRDHFTYAMIKGVQQQRLGSISIVSVEILLSMLGFTINTKNKTTIRESLQKFVDEKIFVAYEDFNCTVEIEEIKMSKTYFFKEVEEKGHFMKMYYEDLYKFLKMDDKNKMKIYTVYFNIISRLYDMDSSDKYTLPNIDEIEKETGINKKTITKYIKTLMENELIYYTMFRLAKDKTKNVYGRWENRDYVDGFAITGSNDS